MDTLLIATAKRLSLLILSRTVPAGALMHLMNLTPMATMMATNRKSHPRHGAIPPDRSLAIYLTY